MAKKYFAFCYAVSVFLIGFYCIHLAFAFLANSVASLFGSNSSETTEAITAITGFLALLIPAVLAFKMYRYQVKKENSPFENLFFRDPKKQPVQFDFKITATPERIENLYQRLTKMSPADLSVLEGALGEPGSHMMTVFGSANDLLWNDMVMIDWMSKKIDTIDIPDEEPRSYPVYKIEPAGAEPLRELLERMYRDNTHSKKMTDIHNDLFTKIVPQIVEPVMEGGGSPDDLITITGLILAYMVHQTHEPGQREEALENLFHKAKRRLQQLAET